MLSFGHQMFQLCGAMLLLVAYTAHQFRWIDAKRPLYNVLNTFGSGILGFYAIWPRFQAGFVVLEVVWTVISIHAIWRALRTENSPA